MKKPTHQHSATDRAVGPPPDEAMSLISDDRELLVLFVKSALTSMGDHLGSLSPKQVRATLALTVGGPEGSPEHAATLALLQRRKVGCELFRP